MKKYISNDKIIEFIAYGLLIIFGLVVLVDNMTEGPTTLFFMMIIVIGCVGICTDVQEIKQYKSIVESDNKYIGRIIKVLDRKEKRRITTSYTKVVASYSDEQAIMHTIEAICTIPEFSGVENDKIYISEFEGEYYIISKEQYNSKPSKPVKLDD
jgi:hypothetical protein